MMEEQKYEKVKCSSSSLKIGLICDVTEDEFTELSTLNDVAGIRFCRAEDGESYDIVIGRGKISAPTVYRINLDQFAIPKVVAICTQITSSYVWSVKVIQAAKPNAWYSKIVDRSIFVYRDSNDFLTEPMSNKKVWDIDVIKSKNKYVHEMQSIKAIDTSSSDSLLGIIKDMSVNGSFYISFAVRINFTPFGKPDQICDAYIDNPSVAWTIMEKLREVQSSEMSIIDIIDNYDNTALGNLDLIDMFTADTNGQYSFDGDMHMRLLVSYKSNTDASSQMRLHADMTFGLDSCTNSTVDAFTFSKDTVYKHKDDLLMRQFKDLVSLATIYPKQVLLNCWLESTGGEIS